MTKRLLAEMLNEILYEIFILLEVKDLLACSLVDKQWNSMANDDVLWKKICCKDYSRVISIIEKETWYQKYQICYFMTILTKMLNRKSSCDPNWITYLLTRPRIVQRNVSTWQVQYLVSNVANRAEHTDENLFNPQGIVIYNNRLFIANGSGDGPSKYDLAGKKVGDISLLRDFSYRSPLPFSLLMNCGAVVGNTIYLANPAKRRIDVYDNNYNRLEGFSFRDGDTLNPIPVSNSPINIVHIGGHLYVLYTKYDDDPSHYYLPWQDEDDDTYIGSGGYISMFNLDGSFVRRFYSCGVLNYPQSMIPAPVGHGFPPGSFLVGNHGDGRIYIIDCNGGFIGPLLTDSGRPIIIPGLCGLAPYYNNINEIYFTGESNTEGIVGKLVKSGDFCF